MLSRIATVVLVLTISIAAAAQTSVGHYVYGQDTLFNPAVPFTVVDLSRPAETGGTIGAVAVRTFSNSCANGFKIRFFRDTTGLGTLQAFTERGPFSVTGPMTVVTLTPPVAISRGEYIGIVGLQTCLLPAAQDAVPGARAVFFNGDVTGPVSVTSGQTFESRALGVYGAASTTSEVRTHVILAAAALPGANNTFFRTDVFLAMPRNGVASGRLVYHPEGTSGVPGNPSRAFNVTTFNTLKITDFVSAIGRSGKGSIDVYVKLGDEPPVASARVYEDSGGGTKGFFMDALAIHEALPRVAQGVLHMPANPAKYRVNIGVRTIAATDIQFGVYANSTTRAFVTRSYPANYYVQTDAASLLGVQLQAGDYVLAYPVHAPAFVYAATNDNTSNDPSLQIAKPIR